MCRKASDSITYKCISISLILLQGIIVALQSKHSSKGTTVASIDRLVTILFCLECLFIMAGYGKQFWLYFLGLRVGKWESHAKWNCFDFIVSFTSLAFLNEEGSSTVACLRLLRLSKILKAIFAHEPGFVVIMEGLKKGMSSISYIITLLLFVLFLYLPRVLFFFLRTLSFCTPEGR